MNQAQLEPLESILAAFNPQRSLLFGSRERTLLADGVFAHVTTPAAGGHDPTSEIQREITQLFAKAKASGIDRPVVIGAIPFDPTRPSQLVIPERCRQIELKVETPKAAPAAGDFDIALCEDAAGREVFQKAVSDALEMFRAGPLQKVVLSRQLDVACGNVDIRKIMLQMSELAPSGYHFSIPIGEDATLIGASPELLLRKQGDKIVSNPLAGSIARYHFGDEKKAAEHLEKSAKDLYEHRLVVEEVAEILAKYCHELSVPKAPSLLQTPTLWHLSTLVQGVLGDGTTNALALASALHPTPAVCGFPRELARQAIAQVEGFDRELFTGMTGWMDADGNGEWVVTIRCGIARKDSVRIFAGAGIVEGSVPEVEWAETNTKLSLMQRILDRAQRKD